MTFYLNDFKNHLSALAEKAKTEGVADYTEPVRPWQNSVSLEEAYRGMKGTLQTHSPHIFPPNHGDPSNIPYGNRPKYPRLPKGTLQTHSPVIVDDSGYGNRPKYPGNLTTIGKNSGPWGNGIPKPPAPKFKPGKFEPTTPGFPSGGKGGVPSDIIGPPGPNPNFYANYWDQFGGSPDTWGGLNPTTHSGPNLTTQSGHPYGIDWRNRR